MVVNDDECKTRAVEAETRGRPKLPNTQIKSQRSSAQCPAIYSSFLNSDCKTRKSDEISFYIYGTQQKKKQPNTSVTLQNTETRHVQRQETFKGIWIQTGR